MTKDGVNPSVADDFGWLPIDQIPLALGYWAAGTQTLHVHAEAIMIEGVTTSGEIVIAVYRADGDYVDRWMNPAWTRQYRLTHGRPI